MNATYQLLHQQEQAIEQLRKVPGMKLAVQAAEASKEQTKRMYLKQKEVKLPADHLDWYGGQNA
ncbi:hypothetical protein [Marinococcus halophilus]|uniref:hypothetical protein n=1 Tax=Marinococcus halophilus TaxID=1371 RepID=UPI0009A73D94|nr:hypothetical protein [Marinococcus halophilus]